jgi:hypothetical protein
MLCYILLKLKTQACYTANGCLTVSFLNIASDKLTSKSAIGLTGIQEDKNSSYQAGQRKSPLLQIDSLVVTAISTWSELGIEVFGCIVDFCDVQPLQIR